MGRPPFLLSEDQAKDWLKVNRANALNGATSISTDIIDGKSTLYLEVNALKGDLHFYCLITI